MKEATGIKSLYTFAPEVGKSEAFFYTKLKTGKIPIHYRFLRWEHGEVMIDTVRYNKAKEEFEAMVEEAQVLFYVFDGTKRLHQIKAAAFYASMRYEKLLTKLFFYRDDDAFLDEYKYLNIRKFTLAAREELKQMNLKRKKS